MLRIGKPMEVAAQSTAASTPAMPSVPVSGPTMSRCMGMPCSRAVVSMIRLSCSLAMAPTDMVKPLPISSGCMRRSPMPGAAT